MDSLRSLIWDWQHAARLFGLRLVCGDNLLFRALFSVTLGRAGLR